MIKLNLDALHHNVERIKTLAPESKVLAVVKDNAYGHGLERVVRTIANRVEGFAVVSIAEGIVIRKMGILKPVVLLQGANTVEEVNQSLEYQLTMVVHHENQFKIIIKNPKKNVLIKIWLKINCGLNRLGFSIEKRKMVNTMLKNIKNLDKNYFCAISHLSSATSSAETTKNEIDFFHHYLTGLDYPSPSAVSKSLASSAGILKYPASHLDWVRPGLALYGVSPFTESSGADFGLLPVMQLEAKVISIQLYRKGEGVGYNKTWVCIEPKVIAILNVGYADGYPFHIKQGTSVLINGERAEIVGRVSSDAISIDITRIKNLKVGDPVILWGSGLAIEEIAACSRTVPDQLLCGVAQRCI